MRHIRDEARAEARRRIAAEIEARARRALQLCRDIRRYALEAEIRSVARHADQVCRDIQRQIHATQDDTERAEPPPRAVERVPF